MVDVALQIVRRRAKAAKEMPFELQDTWNRRAGDLSDHKLVTMNAIGPARGNRGSGQSGHDKGQR
jgi:hypothetical protein